MMVSMSDAMPDPEVDPLYGDKPWLPDPEETEREALADLIEATSTEWEADFKAEGIRIGNHADFLANRLIALGFRRLSESEIREAQFDRDAALETAANYRAALVNNAHAKIAELSKWIDSSYPAEMIGTELHTRRRVDKLMEEAGEVGEAVGGWYGENPRKGVTHGLDDVLGELLDVAITALGAYESLTFNTGESGPALDAKIDKVLTRVGIEVSRA